MTSTADNTTVVELIDDVVESWRADADLTAQTSQRMGEIAARFARRLHTTGITRIDDVDEETCQSFIDAPTRTGSHPTDATRHFRRVTLRALFRTAREFGYPVGDPTLDIELPPRSERSTRPLTTDEVVLGRTATFTSRNPELKRATAWALAEAGATTSEIPLVTADHLDDICEPTHITLPGTRRVDARINPLTGWGAAIITRRLTQVEAGQPLVYEGAGGEVARQAAVCKLISIVLTEAGLIDGDIRPESIRLWRARTGYDTDGELIAAARLLGARSLDRTAEALDVVWRQP